MPRMRMQQPNPQRKEMTELLYAAFGMRRPQQLPQSPPKKQKQAKKRKAKQAKQSRRAQRAQR